MKTVLLYLTLLFSLSLWAQDIDAKMQKIRQASPEVRVELMNQLKQEIAQMNQNERTKAINELRLEKNLKGQIDQDVNKEQFKNSQETMSKQNFNQQQGVAQQMKMKSQNPMKYQRR